MEFFLIFVITSHFSFASRQVFDYGVPFDTANCSLSSSLLSEISEYKSIAKAIYREITEGSSRNETYMELAQFVETFGARLSGSTSLENSLAYMEEKLQSLGLENVHSEQASVYKLERIVTEARMISPQEQKVSIIAAGTSAPTPEAGITKFVIVAPSLRLLVNHLDKFGDKIVLFDYFGAKIEDMLLAEIAGAAAILLRSHVSFSNHSLTATKGENPSKPIIKIPLASITNEDSDLMSRLYNSGVQIQLYMNLQQSLSVTPSRNVIGDYRGRAKPEEIVVVSGHADSWDLSQGATDDGIGVVMSYQVPRIFQKLRLIPKRTIRTIFWTGEEFGGIGAKQYVKNHKEELGKYSTVLEADFGCFHTRGYTFSGPGKYGCILDQVMRLLGDELGLLKLSQVDGKKNVNEHPKKIPNSLTTDIREFFLEGIPGANLNGDTDDTHKYFWYHHTQADTIGAVDTKLLDKCMALYATTAYVMADLDDMMPRTDL